MKQRNDTGKFQIEDLEVGDVIYEYCYGEKIESVVITKPVLNNGMWKWESREKETGGIIEYSQRVDHYVLNIYKCDKGEK